MRNQIWFHIDVNNAFLSWTAVDEIEAGKQRDLRTLPAIIGGDRSLRHGVVLAKSMIAKSYGVQTGEPVTDALKKCPNLIIVQPNHERYSWHSQRLMKLLCEYSPEINQYSIDECFLRYFPAGGWDESSESGRLQIIKDAEALKDRIKNTLGFTVNIGISTNKLLAKMASDFQKPNRVHTLFQDEIQKKMWPLPVSELFMVGKMSAQRLRMLGIKTIGDLAQMDKRIIESQLKSHGRLIWEYANGIEANAIEGREKTEYKGIGNSTTLSHDVTDRKEISEVMRRLSEKVALRLRNTDQLAGMVCVEIKYYDFRSVSHQAQLLSPTNSTEMIYKSSEKLFDELWTGTPVRLLGIRLSKLCDMDQQQLSLFDMPNCEKMQKLDSALDAIRNKYGENAVVRGSRFQKNQDKLGWETDEQQDQTGV